GKVPGSGKKKKKATRQRPQVAADAYGSIAEAVDQLLESTKTNNLARQDRAVAWLSDRGDPAIEPLANILGSSDHSDAARIVACQVLSKLGPGARPALLQATGADARMVRVSASRRLGMIRPSDQQTVDRLVTLLGHEDQQTRRAAVQSLGSIGKSADVAIDPLVEIYNNKKNTDLLRNDAVQALKKINPRKDFTDLLLND
ncbi:MAG: HEAT repeat domain-containing protein, partial [Pirellulaceae bacterium]|nr:HEAT repeat domain-containing protein [Pirellulaceae bacterium]